MESIDPPIPKKAVGWTEKHFVLCKKHGGAYTMHKTHDFHQYNRVGTPIKRSVSTSKPQSKKQWTEGMNFTQIIHTECKKAFHAACKQANKSKNSSELK